MPKAFLVKRSAVTRYEEDEKLERNINVNNNETLSSEKEQYCNEKEIIFTEKCIYDKLPQREIYENLSSHNYDNQSQNPFSYVTTPTTLFKSSVYELDYMRNAELPYIYAKRHPLYQDRKAYVLEQDSELNSASRKWIASVHSRSPDVVIPSPSESNKYSQSSDEMSSACSLSPPHSGNPTKIFFPTEINEAKKFVTEDFKKHQCQVCLKWFKRASSLSNHRLIHKNLKSFKCEDCGMSFLRKSDLGKHMVIHTGIKPYECSTCGKRFSQSSNMLTHQRRHSGVRPYSCSYCGKSFYRKVDVRRHSIVHREY